MAKLTTERKVVRLIDEEIKGKIPGLIEIRRDYHLSGAGPESIAEKWDLASLGVDLHPDLVFVFRAHPGAKPFLAAVEVKVFQSIEKASIHEGWGQALAYTLFGFDGVALWHFFLEEPSRPRADRYHLFGEQMVAAWGAGAWYFAGRLNLPTKRVSTSWGAEMSVPDFVGWAYQGLLQNPSSHLAKAYVASRRTVLLADMKIPS